VGALDLRRVGLVIAGTGLAMFRLPLVGPVPNRAEGLTICYPVVGPVQRFNPDLSEPTLSRVRAHEAAHASQCHRDGAVWHFVRDLAPSQRLHAEAEAFCAEANFAVANGGQPRLEYAHIQDELREMSWFHRFSSDALAASLASRCPTLAAAAARQEAEAHTAIPQSPTPTTPVGTWRGTSKCLVRPSACHDEVVVYRIKRLKAADSASVDAFKIVNGKEDEMGLLGCRVMPGSGQLACSIPHGVWYFTPRGDSLTGELRLPDKTRFREVRAARSR